MSDVIKDNSITTLSLIAAVLKNVVRDPMGTVTVRYNLPHIREKV